MRAPAAGETIAAALALAVGLALTAPVAHARPLVEVRVTRGVGGVVAAGGIDVVELEVRSGADAAVRMALVVEGRPRTVDLAARGTATLTLARRLAPGASGLPAVAVRTDDGAVVATIPAARVTARPVIVVTDDAATMLPRVDGWRQREGLGAPAAVAPDGLPTRWQALVGVAALVLDRPTAALAPAAAQQVRRYLATGGMVCRWAASDAAPVCVRAAAIAVPRTRQAATVAGAVRRLGMIALGVAGALMVASVAAARIARRRRQRGGRSRRRGRAAVVGAALIGVASGMVAPFVRSPDDGAVIRGVRVAAGDGEEWVAAELGASDLDIGDRGAGDVLAGDLWIERSGPSPSGAAAVFDDGGLRGRVPGAGSWRVRGFVAATTARRGWAARLAAVARPSVEAP